MRQPEDAGPPLVDPPVFDLLGRQLPGPQDPMRVIRDPSLAGNCFKFRAAWTWWDGHEDMIKRLCSGSTLHVCCGQSPIGDVRVDLYTACDVKADFTALPFKGQSFDTVIIDPPWGHWAPFWTEAARVARRRLVIVHKTIFKVPRWTDIECYVLAPLPGFKGRIVTVYEPIQERLLLNNGGPR